MLPFSWHFTVGIFGFVLLLMDGGVCVCVVSSGLLLDGEEQTKAKGDQFHFQII